MVFKTNVFEVDIDENKFVQQKIQMMYYFINICLQTH